MLPWMRVVLTKRESTGAGWSQGEGSQSGVSHHKAFPTLKIQRTCCIPSWVDYRAKLHHRTAHELYEDAVTREKVFWNRLKGKGKRKVGWLESGKNALFSSCTCSIT